MFKGVINTYCTDYIQIYKISFITTNIIHTRLKDILFIADLFLVLTPSSGGDINVSSVIFHGFTVAFIPGAQHMIQPTLILLQPRGCLDRSFLSMSKTHCLIYHKDTILPINSQLSNILSFQDLKIQVLTDKQYS